MMVNGPLEIYSTVIGAKLYDAIFNILVSTGIAFIPLIVIFFQNITTPYEMPIGSGADTSLRRVAVQFLILIFAIMIFAAPTHKLDVTEIVYKPVCSENAIPSQIGDTGTTYDEAFKNLKYDDIRIPIGLSAVLTGASGITNAAIVSLPCKTDVQEIQQAIDTTRLTPELAQQVSRFNNECYAVARSKFNNQKPDKSQWQDIMINYGGQSDLSWVGSHTLRRLYYTDIYPSNPVRGFPYNEFPYQYQDYNKKEGVKTPKWGFPSCEEWWTDDQYGIEKQLVDLVNQRQSKDPHLGKPLISDQVQNWIQEAQNYHEKLGSELTSKDIIIRNLLYNKSSEGGFGNFYSGWMDDSITSFNDNNVTGYKDSTPEGFFGGLFAQTGQTIKAGMSAIDRAEIAQEIPIIQAILMALCLAFGPIIIILGGYRFNVIFSYYFILSSIITMTFVEKLIHYLELSLHASQSYGLYALGNSMVMYNIFTKLYFFAPLLYLMLMSICGVSVGSSMKGMFDKSVSGSFKETAKNVGKAMFK